MDHFSRETNSVKPTPEDEMLIPQRSVGREGPTLGDQPNGDPAVVSIELHDHRESKEKSVTDLCDEPVRLENKSSASAAIVILEKASGEDDMVSDSPNRGSRGDNWTASATDIGTT